jgi:hypothetical protein
MADYRLDGLNPRDFEHLVQALAKKEIAAGVTPFGDGPDGGREAAFEGPMSYPTKPAPWNGYLVVQCKFNLRPHASHASNLAWLEAELKKELRKFLRKRSPRRRPEYFLLATNITLTAVARTGTKDRALDTLTSYAKKLGLKGFDIWSYDEICRFLDANDGVRKTYAGFLTSGDAIEAIIKAIEPSTRDFRDVVFRFLQKELNYDRSARLESAAAKSDGAESTLAQVFVDLPATTNGEAAHSVDAMEEGPGESGPILQHLVATGGRILRPGVLDTAEELFGPDCDPRIAIVGGPGQGKSTIVQYLCQVHRAALLKAMGPRGLTATSTAVIKALQESELGNGRPLPQTPRLPFKVVLNQYATDLEKQGELSILEYVRRRFSDLGSTECSRRDIDHLLHAYPWLFVFDGLDEVPASSNRDDVLKQIQNFFIDIAASEADVQVVATTRPQGYSQEFESSNFKHWYLQPLSSSLALDYAKLLVDVKWGDNDELKRTILRRLEQACKTDATSRLMQTPLQVTIMTVLVARLGEPPRQRYRLFAQYYRTIYDRESSREGALSRLLSQRVTDIDTIHYRTGLLLQTESERAGRTEARLTDQQFSALVKARLRQVGASAEDDAPLVKELTDGSLDRLVFLVRPIAGHVAFEIRSLQEFMAAEALLKEDEKAVIRRLQALAPISHWRNVFLFAVGNCFAEREHLIPTICALCESLNQRGSGALCEAALWGSQLALDILTDGVAALHPIYEQTLATTALRLLDRCDHETAARLAAVYKPNLKSLFDGAITDRIAHSDLVKRVGALRLLRAVAEKGEPWAAEKLDAVWPKRISEQKQVALPLPQQQTPPWLLPKVLPLLPYLNPLEFFRNTRVGDKGLPEWVSKSRNLGSLRMRTTAALSVTFSLSRAPSAPRDSNTVRLKLRSIADETLRNLQEIRQVEWKHRLWSPVCAALAFAKEPTKDSLALALRTIGKEGDAGLNDVTISCAPWPLSACLSHATVAAELEEMAVKAETGAYGDGRSWLDAEQRWRANGTNLEALASEGDQRWPLANYSESGFPFSSAARHVGFGSNANTVLLVREAANFPDGFAKRWLCGLAQDHLVTGLPRDRQLRLEPHLLQSMFEHAKRGRRSLLRLDWVTNIDIPKQLDERWMKLFVALANLPVGFFWYGEFVWAQTQQLAARFLQNMNQEPALLKILACLVKIGNKTGLPPSVLQPAQYSDFDHQFAALIILIAEHGLSEREADTIMDWITADHDRVKRFLPNILSHLNEQNVNPTNVSQFANAVNRRLIALPQGVFSDPSLVQLSLIRDLNTRTSPLNQPGAWTEFGFPVIS